MLVHELLRLTQCRHWASLDGNAGELVQPSGFVLEPCPHLGSTLENDFVALGHQEPHDPIGPRLAVRPAEPERGAEHPHRPHVTGEDADAVEAGRQRSYPCCAECALGGLVADDTAECGWDPHRAGGVRAQRERDQACGHGSSRTGRGAAGDKGHVP